ncbi:MAG: ribonuclease III domain-containing protein [Anaerovoracaceae bacterium]
MKIENINTTTLAFMGDAVYEEYVRKHVISLGEPGADRLHRMAVKYVKAEGQAVVIKKILESLSKEEQGLVRRARNRKSATRPKNVDHMTYKWATAFEALIGHLYLSEKKERMEEIIGKAIEIVDGKVE